MGQVSKSQGTASEVFEAPVDRFCGSVAAAGPVEVGKDVGCSSFQGPAELADLGQRCGDAIGDVIDQPLEELLAGGLVGVSVAINIRW